MTLAEWSTRYQVRIETHDRSGARYVFELSSVDPEAYRSIYRLTDYKVSTRSGPVLWLCPCDTSDGT